MAKLENIAEPKTILPILTSLVSDPVPNVRFNVAKILLSIYPQVPKRVAANEILTSLRNLVKDTDSDVKFFAKEAVDRIVSS